MKKVYLPPRMDITMIEANDIVCSSKPIKVTITTPQSQSLGETPPIPYSIINPTTPQS